MSNFSSSLSNLSDWDLIVSFLHYNGSNYGKLSHDNELTVRYTADGFGRLNGNSEDILDMLFDWSHIRDSSKEAVRDMADIIRLYL